MAKAMTSLHGVMCDHSYLCSSRSGLKRGVLLDQLRKGTAKNKFVSLGLIVSSEFRLNMVHQWRHTTMTFPFAIYFLRFANWTTILKSTVLQSVRAWLGSASHLSKMKAAIFKKRVYETKCNYAHLWRWGESVVHPPSWLHWTTYYICVVGVSEGREGSRSDRMSGVTYNSELDGTICTCQPNERVHIRTSI